MAGNDEGFVGKRENPFPYRSKKLVHAPSPKIRAADPLVEDRIARIELLGRRRDTGFIDRRQTQADTPGTVAGCVNDLPAQGPNRDLFTVFQVFVYWCQCRRGNAAHVGLRFHVVVERLIVGMRTFFIPWQLAEAYLMIGDFDAAVDQTLNDIGEICGANRSYLFLINKDKKTLDNTHEWCSDGVQPQLSNFQDVSKYS